MHDFEDHDYLQKLQCYCVENIIKLNDIQYIPIQNLDSHVAPVNASIQIHTSCTFRHMMCFLSYLSTSLAAMGQDMCLA